MASTKSQFLQANVLRPRPPAKPTQRRRADPQVPGECVLCADVLTDLRSNQVHVHDKNISNCFPTNSGNGTLQGKTLSPNHSSSAPCCVVVANRIEDGHTDRCERQEAKANEGVGEAAHGINACGTVRRCNSQCRSGSWTALKPRENLLRSVQKRQDCLSTVAAFNTSLMLPTSPRCHAPPPPLHGLEGVHLG